MAQKIKPKPTPQGGGTSKGVPSKVPLDPETGKTITTGVDPRTRLTNEILQAWGTIPLEQRRKDWTWGKFYGHAMMADSRHSAAFRPGIRQVGVHESSFLRMSVSRTSFPVTVSPRHTLRECTTSPSSLPKQEFCRIAIFCYWVVLSALLGKKMLKSGEKFELSSEPV